MRKKNKTGFFSGNESKKTLHKNLEFTAMEQYKLLRTNLSFTLPQDEKCPIIGVTSAMRGEGKSTTSVNLAYVLAESGKKVLLIDGDMRIPSIAKKMGIENNFGLTDLLKGAGSVQMNDFKYEEFNNFYIMPSGALPPNPSELLGSVRMKNIFKSFSESFDCIVLDLPPVNLVSDALAVSQFISGMVVVIRADYSEKRELENCFRQLRLSDVNVLGCVINDYKDGRGSYGKYKRYYKYKTYGESPEKE
ncbi:MAG: CpsD/CapB family tyrosine-protein kinase [Clostridia bacterium]|nr:CpsD/CapB family tyrosine-protein kinase [Clostridia bacterium]